MDTSTKVKVSFSSIAKLNEALAADIRNLAQSQQPSSLPSEGSHDEANESQLKVLLERLYVLICDFGQYRGNAATPDKKIITCWESFLVPIGALSEVKPHGHMMAARMILYLTSAFLGNGQLPQRLPFDMSSAKPVALRCNWLIALDDALLSQLTQIWSHSDKCEMFSWVFSDYLVRDCRKHYCCNNYLQPGQTLEQFHERRNTDRFKAACVTRPCKLTPANGVQGRWRWTRPQGDTTTAYRREPDCYSWGDDHRFRTQDGNPLLMWQDLGSDGPIRDQYHYTLVDEDRRESHWRGRPALRRSRQFVLDARKLATVNLSRERRRLAVVALARSPLPVELEVEVLSYLKVPEQDPYLSKLDLSAVYRPFPDKPKDYAKCPHPHTITIWSLPLRMFHKFHLDGRNEWSLCLLNDCSGRHSNGLWNWSSRDEELEEYLDKSLQRRCGPGTTVKSIGLGPLDPVELPTAKEDRERHDRLFSRNNDDDFERGDKLEEAHWIGITGLADAMLHGRTLFGRHPSGSITTDAQWLLGRTRHDEQRAISGLQKVHGRCSYC